MVLVARGMLPLSLQPLGVSTRLIPYYQLKAFKSGERSNGPIMMDISSKLSDNEMEALACYLEGLH